MMYTHIYIYIYMYDVYIYLFFFIPYKSRENYIYIYMMYILKKQSNHLMAPMRAFFFGGVGCLRLATICRSFSLEKTIRAWENTEY